MFLLLDGSLVNFHGGRMTFDQVKLRLEHTDQRPDRRPLQPDLPVEDPTADHAGLARSSIRPSMRPCSGARTRSTSCSAPKGWPYVKPLEDAAAEDLAERRNLKSMKSILAARGVDEDDHIAEVVAGRGKFIRAAIREAQAIAQEFPGRRVAGRGAATVARAALRQRGQRRAIGGHGRHDQRRNGSRRRTAGRRQPWRVISSCSRDSRSKRRRWRTTSGCGASRSRRSVRWSIGSTASTCTRTSLRHCRGEAASDAEADRTERDARRHRHAASQRAHDEERLVAGRGIEHRAVATAVAGRAQEPRGDRRDAGDGHARRHGQREP